ncbi:MAG: prolipoprotein diacylglyceryl transferase [Synergistaceae bacterium]|nr:prolipoprotein diacylglyceryl transferase [Synergistaceae bacterium]MBQ6982686.1 prolipoprotein diacylglyceryl transferase [Synergistaceae bacterium]
MHPTLFHVFGLRIDTYSVIWFIALSVAILWVIKRLPLYGLDEYESRKIMAVSFFFMLLGARSFEYIQHWKQYMANPSLFLDINRGGVHEFGAVSGAFLSALIMCMFSRKVSFSRLCDAAAPPAILAITIGRWGCFMNGCCVGIRTKSFLGVHFPFDRAGILRHPVQIYYSVIALMIVGILLAVEKRVLPRQKGERHYSVIAPLAIILYSMMRLVVAPLRNHAIMARLISRSMTYRGVMIALPLMSLWLAYSLSKLKTVHEVTTIRR